jgi:hypothetical protein
MADKLTSFDFSALVAAIRQVDERLADQASRAVNISLTLRNWLIGAYIAEYELCGADRATYGDSLLTELAKRLTDLRISNSNRRQLYRYLRINSSIGFHTVIWNLLSISMTSSSAPSTR